MIYKHPEKVVIIAREKSGEMKCSLRSGKNVVLAKMLEKALVGIEGYGGGHEQACGAVIKKEDFKQFLINLSMELKTK
jgi:single-stranded DNA-specific DHH superfamily exonuclease